ncbi:MAG: SsrA-binding protein SmpB [Oscillospiraceae bacterium]|jgi:SsrA-binding protein|nr:SsrA-binding protein SmpB [Oscillospiraceae bacterium]
MLESFCCVVFIVFVVGGAVGSAQIKTISRNRKAFHNYTILESFEAGIKLLGTEVKSLRLSKVNIKDSWCNIVKSELIINQLHISHYKHSNVFNHDPIRPRCLLVKKKEIARLYGLVKRMGYSIVPLSIYLKGSLFKVQVGLCKGKKIYEKRRDMADKSAKRDIERTMKNYYSNKMGA